MRQLRLASLALAAALALAGCGEGAGDGAPAAATGEPLPVVAAPAGQPWTETVTRTAEGGYRVGNPDAPIRLIEFMSTTCSHCAEFAEASFEPLMRDFVSTGRVSFELRNFVRDPLDLTVSMLTRCGPESGYFALTEQALANQAAMFQQAQGFGDAGFQQAQTLPPEQRFIAIAQGAGLTEFFAQRGISKDQQAACLAKAETATELAQRTEADARQYDLQGTPTFVINGTKEDLATWPQVKARLEELGAR